MSRTPSRVRVRPAEQTGHDGVSRQSGRRLTSCRDLESQTASRDFHEAENAYNQTEEIRYGERRAARATRVTRRGGNTDAFKPMSGWRRAASSRRAAKGRWIWAVTPRDRHDGVIQWSGMNVAVCEGAAMSDVTRILCAIDQGDPAAAEQLLPLVYEELRRLAAQKLSHRKARPDVAGDRRCTRRISYWSAFGGSSGEQPRALLFCRGRGDAPHPAESCPGQEAIEAEHYLQKGSTCKRWCWLSTCPPTSCWSLY